MAHKSGMVAIVGKPNVGKSTLLNAFVGHKVSIVSNKSQTTRRRVLGIVQGDDYQIAFIDTPGIHEPHTALGKAMVDGARQALEGVDLILFVADSSHLPNEIDRQIAKLIEGVTGRGVQSLICLNKMDRLRAEMVQPTVDAYSKMLGNAPYMLTTATKGHNLSKLLEAIVDRLPEGDALFPEDEYTDQPLRFLVSELVREKVLERTRQEVPHATAVLVDDWDESSDLVRIRSTVVVEKAGQKAILIGGGGKFIKEIGSTARQEIEQLVQKRVFLELFVKVMPDWRMNPRMLHDLEYTQ